MAGPASIERTNTSAAVTPDTRGCAVRLTSTSANPIRVLTTGFVAISRRGSSAIARMDTAALIARWM